ncbi:MAG TPA: carbamoyltransferase C-terminal domain-containing protein [Pyrinomonadaceae bacterium]|nr:carbamoyltransferase C-terminal domain-containing protein [Pyrinomonadaceae bacterium]
MSDERLVLGVNRTADASICLLGSSSFICSIQKERLTRQKHDWGKPNDFRDLYAKRLIALRRPVELVVECYSSDDEIENIESYHEELREVLKFSGEPRIVQISHHLAHLYSTFCLSPDKEMAVMVVDFQGSPARLFTETWPGAADAPPDWLEVSSFYRCGERGVECLSKQLWDGDRSRPAGLGAFYGNLTATLFEGPGCEGKVMGLAPFGDRHALGLPPPRVEGERVFIPDAWLEVFADDRSFRFFADGTGTFERCADLAAAGQWCFEEALLQLAAWLHRQTVVDTLCFAGGTALNCVANGRLLRESPFRNVFIPPSPHDGGTALGCALYGLVECLGVPNKFQWVDDFLGPDTESDGLDALLDDGKFSVERPSNLVEQVVELLESGRVVALYNGRSELGPRALGHRSILADPRHPHIRTWINRHVKGRELFRPLAPVVLLEAASRFFDIDRPAPFMQFAADVRPDKRDFIPAVTHVDGTARLQTVSEHDDPFLYSLLKAFEARTGIGVLLNTSFNGREEPIVETAAEAVNCFKTTAMHALVMPPYVIRKKSEPEIPPRGGGEALDDGGRC